MSYALGVDIGTTFVTTALARPGDGENAHSDLLAYRREASLVLIDEGGEVLFGNEAEQLGSARPERLVRGFTRRIGDEIPIAVGETAITPERVFALVARRVVDEAEQQEGGPPRAVALSLPVGWGDYRIGLVKGALEKVGLAGAMIVSEPLAAAAYHASTIPIDTDAAIAVYDFSASRFTVSILRKTDTAFRLLATDTVDRIGGSRFDSAIARLVAGDLLGVDTADPAARDSLATLRRACVHAKETLSSESEVSVLVALPPAAEHRVLLGRSEFEQLITEAVQRTVGVVRRAMSAAEVEVLAGVRLVGGSSAIPLVPRLVAEGLGAPIAVRSDPEFSVALGAAIRAAASIDPADQDDDDAVASRPERSPWFKRGPSGSPSAVRRGASVLVSAIAAIAGTQPGQEGVDRMSGPDQPGPVG